MYLKSDVVLLTCVFEKLIEKSIFEFDINTLFVVSLHDYARQCGLKYTCNNLPTTQDKKMIVLLENNNRGNISSIMGDKFVKSDEIKSIQKW